MSSAEEYTELEKAQIEAISFAHNFSLNMLLYVSLVKLVESRDNYLIERDILSWSNDELALARINELNESIAITDVSIANIANDQLDQDISA